MKNDAVLKIAVCVYSNPGAYALLLGAGISYTAGIPTGRAIEEKLISMIAAIEHANLGTDSRAWYKTTFGEPPVYDNLMDRLTKTSAERMVLLRRYIEPTEQEREDDQKTPTKAHKAIASLVKDGYIRMILTTNFDQLTEQALEAVGVHPFVVASDADTERVPPHAVDREHCYVVKVNGDYLNTDIKNTGQELEHYSPKMEKYLDGILDVYGLIICGWSSSVDKALRKALFRTPGKHFTTFWLTREPLIPEASMVSVERQAEEVKIQTADNFFIELEEHVQALKSLSGSRPLDTATAVQTVKRYIPEPRYRVRLGDFVRLETESVRNRMLAYYQPNTTRNPIERLKNYKNTAEKLLAMVSALGFYDEGENALLLTYCIESLTRIPETHGSDIHALTRYYPALLLLYATGICAVANHHYKTVSSILRETGFRDSFNRRHSILAVLLPLGFKVFANIDTWDRLFPPANNYVYDELRDSLREFLPTEEEYSEKFDLFESILALTYVELVGTKNYPLCRSLGVFRTLLPNRLLRGEWGNSPFFNFQRSEETQGDNWDLLQHGLFGGSSKEFRDAMVKYETWLREINLLE